MDLSLHQKKAFNFFIFFTVSSINYLVSIIIFKTKDIMLKHFLGWVLTLCAV